MTADKVDFTGSTDTNREPLADPVLHKIPLTEQQAAIAQMHPGSSPDWLKDFTITEGSGAAVGAIGGAGFGYIAGSQFGTAGAFLLNAMGSGRTVLPFSEVPAIARLASLRGAGYGALAGLAVAGIGYGLYEGYEHFKPETT